jgi:hypothetical protein
VEFALVDLASHMDAAMLRFLVELRRFDALSGYLLGGFASTAHWLVARCGLNLATARERVRVAKALELMPRTAKALGEGRISYSVARALTRLRAGGPFNAPGAAEGDSAGQFMDPEDEAALLEAACTRTADGVEAMVRAWAMKSPQDETERELARMAARKLSIRPRHDGMWEVRGLLTPEIGAALLAAVDEAADHLFREARPGAPYAAPDPRENPNLRVDGIPLAEWEAQGGKLPPEAAALLGSEDTAAAARRRRADALGLICELALARGGGAGHTPPASGLRAATTQVVLHVELAALGKDGGPENFLDGDPSLSDPFASGHRPAAPALSHLPGSVRVSAETSRRLACDASVVPLVVRKGLGPRKLDALRELAGESGQNGADAVTHAEVRAGELHSPELVGLGAATRTVSPSLRRALEARDGGCRFPGCDCRFAEAHHVVHSADGGETSVRNCILLCRHHHMLLHEGGWRMAWPPGLEGRGNPTFHDPLGGVHHAGRLRRPGIGRDARGRVPRDNAA